MLSVERCFQPRVAASDSDRAVLPTWDDPPMRMIFRLRFVIAPLSFGHFPLERGEPLVGYF